MCAVDITSGSIDEDVDILMIVHPQELTDEMLYAVDQHVMKVGSDCLS